MKVLPVLLMPIFLLASCSRESDDARTTRPEFQPSEEREEIYMVDGLNLVIDAGSDDALVKSRREIEPRMSDAERESFRKALRVINDHVAFGQLRNPAEDEADIEKEFLARIHGRTGYEILQMAENYQAEIDDWLKNPDLAPPGAPPPPEPPL